MLIISTMDPIKYRTAAMTACQNPWEYVWPGLIGASYSFIATTIAINCHQSATVLQYIYLPKHTIPVAIYQEIIVNGNATIYLILFVKLTNKHRFPKNPAANDTAFNIISLYIYMHEHHIPENLREVKNSPMRIRDIYASIISTLR